MGARGSVRFVHFDICRSTREFLSELWAQVPGPHEFDIVTMSGFCAPPKVIRECAFRLAVAVGSHDGFIFIDNDRNWFNQNYTQWPRRFGRRYPDFRAFAMANGF